MDQTFNIVIQDEIIKITGELTNIKGYKGFNFILYTLNNKWCINEHSTGLTIATAITKAGVKKQARTILAEKTGKDKKILRKIIDNKQKINEII